MADPLIPTCVCVVAVNTDGQVATSARRHDHNAWGLPGGKVDPEDGDPSKFETLLQAAVRELEEETGLQTTTDDLEGLYTNVCYDESGGGNPPAVTATFLAKTWSGTLQQREGEPPAAWNGWEVLLEAGAFRSYNQAVYDTLSNRNGAQKS